MTRRMIFPLLFGIAGAGILISLGVWQLQRLEWKEAIIAEIDARIGADPVALPADPDPARDRYLPVTARGDLTGEALQVLVSTRTEGAGHSIISAFVLEDGRSIMVDEGYVRRGGELRPGPAEGVTVTGNLHWPDEVDNWTPEPDLSDGLFFARDVPAMAATLGTEPVLIIARDIEGTAPRATAMPVGTEGIPNDHLGYAIQWFGLAAVWAGMTGWLLWRIRQRQV
jgi:surfeit locus 1 family protein